VEGGRARALERRRDGKEFSLSFLADALGVSPGKRRSSSMSNGGGDHAGYTPRR